MNVALSTTICTEGLIVAALLILAILLVIFLLASTSAQSSGSTKAAHDEIRRIGAKTRHQIKQTADAYQAEAYKVINHKE